MAQRTYCGCFVYSQIISPAMLKTPCACCDNTQHEPTDLLMSGTRPRANCSKSILACIDCNYLSVRSSQCVCLYVSSGTQHQPAKSLGVAMAQAPQKTASIAYCSETRYVATAPFPGQFLAQIMLLHYISLSNATYLRHNGTSANKSSSWLSSGSGRGGEPTPGCHCLYERSLLAHLTASRRPYRPGSEG
eukprot:6204005-Pleurochrysis_carterae.AAC.2